MTKPAAVFLQLIGLLMALMGGGLAADGSPIGGAIVGVTGLFLIFLGGRAVRRRISAK